MSVRKSNKGRKIGRQRESAQNKRYMLKRQHQKSHIKRLESHLERFPNDEAAKKTLKKYETSFT